jgi:hypothetical protein
VAPRAEVLGNELIGGEKALRMPWRLESSHTPLSLAHRLVGVFGAIVQVSVPAVFHTGQHLPFRRLIAPQFVGHDHTRHIREPLEELAEEPFGCGFVPELLDQDVKDVTVLIHRPPETVALPIDRQKDLIEMPCITRSGTSVPELMGVLWPELATPFPDRFVGHDNAADEQEFLHITIAETKAEIELHAMTDDLGRETVVLVAVGGDGCVHPPSISHRMAAQQVDKATVFHTQLQAGNDFNPQAEPRYDRVRLAT